MIRYCMIGISALMIALLLYVGVFGDAPLTLMWALGLGLNGFSLVLWYKSKPRQKQNP